MSPVHDLRERLHLTSGRQPPSVSLHSVNQRLTLFLPPCLSQQRSGPAGDPSTQPGSLCSPKPQVGRVQTAGSRNWRCLCHTVSQFQTHRSHAQWEGMETLHRHQDNSLPAPKTGNIRRKGALMRSFIRRESPGSQKTDWGPELWNPWVVPPFLAQPPTTVCSQTQRLCSFSGSSLVTGTSSKCL